MTKKTFGVVGGGAVGTAVAQFYGELKIFDKYKNSDSIEEVANTDIIFVAVPTPFTEGKFDLSEMNDAVENLVQNLKRPDEQVVVIKSTVPPGTTDHYQEKFPKVNFIFSPEFLTEKTAVEDFAKPDKQLVGYTDKTKEIADDVLSLLPTASYKKVLPAKVCEMVKYTINSYYSFKVIFANQIYDYSESLDVEFDQVREGLEADKRIIPGNFDVLHGGFRGYKGKCLPKDIKTLIWYAEKLGVSSKLLKTVDRLNEELAKNG